MINGNDGDDTIFAGNDNDRAYGGNGNDFICGEGERDSAEGGYGDDYLGGGMDNVKSNLDQKDYLFGNGGYDVGEGDLPLIPITPNDYIDVTIEAGHIDALVTSSSGGQRCAEKRFELGIPYPGYGVPSGNTPGSPGSGIGPTGPGGIVVGTPGPSQPVGPNGETWCGEHFYAGGQGGRCGGYCPSEKQCSRSSTSGQCDCLPV